MKKKIEGPKFPDDYEFNEMVDLVAGSALLQLIKGDSWRSIVWGICMGANQWTIYHKK